MKQSRILVAFVCLPLLHGTLLAAESGPAPSPVLKPGAHLAIVGDSITEQKLYSAFIDLYLTVCCPELNVDVAQFGWSGETAAGFVNRMDYDLAWFKPDVVTTCYGMNDGGYGAFTEAIGKRYQDSMAVIVSRLRAQGAVVVVGSPGVVDSRYFARGGATNAAAVYNDNLAHLRDLARAVADTNGFPFANVHDAMLEAMEKSKAALGADYDIGGRDGVHPGPNGHLAMAFAFLKALGLDGQIGTVTFSMKDNTASTTEGHKILSAAAGKVEIESRRYPFCFTGDEKQSGGTRSILPFLPFNQELNRFILKIPDAPAANVQVTWGSAKRTFTAAELAAGVNLADAFIPNPFNEPCAKVAAAIASRQSFETAMIKQVITQQPMLMRMIDNDPTVAPMTARIVELLAAKRSRLAQAVDDAFLPVTHTLKVEAAP